MFIIRVVSLAVRLSGPTAIHSIRCFSVILRCSCRWRTK